MAELASNFKERLDLTRRQFLTWLSAVSVTLSGIFALGTVVRQIQPPERSMEGKVKLGWVPVIKMSNLSIGEPKLLPYGDEWVYVTKISAKKIIALNSACPHMLCKLPWNPRTKKYECPCHASSFTVAGKRLGGPAPRDMWAMKMKIEKGKVYIGGQIDGPNPYV
jgi:Rieske Fe-S protein